MHSPTSIHNTDVAILNRLIGAAIEDLYQRETMVLRKLSDMLY